MKSNYIDQFCQKFDLPRNYKQNGKFYVWEYPNMYTDRLEISFAKNNIDCIRYDGPIVSMRGTLPIIDMIHQNTVEEWGNWEGGKV